jgi:ribA/ribD-fused uncharacterized protein
MILKSNNDDLKERLVRFEAYNRRENLIFFGIEQNTGEICCEVITRVIRDILKVPDVNNMKFDRCHRLSSSKSRPQPLIVRFTCGADRDKVWKARYNLAEADDGTGIKKKCPISVSEDFPPEIIARRKSLYPIMKKARELGHVASLSSDKLYVDKVMYTIHTLNSLPRELDPAYIATKTFGKVTGFYSGHSPLSNFHQAEFKIRDETFSHVEQFLQYQKALFCEKHDVAKQIRAATSPLMCKRLGDALHVKVNEWLPVAKDVVLKACEAKFSQNERARKFLKDTGNTVLAEATTDLYWGTGIKLGDESIAVRENWKGKNTLGQILMHIRDNV